METTEILESNKLIAEFMGGKKDSGRTEWFYFSTIGKYIRETDLDYNCSWDWIMPVVEKIDQIGASVIIGRMFCEIGYTDPLNQSKGFKVRIASGVKINAINGAVIDFIKWYNENQ